MIQRFKVSGELATFSHRVDFDGILYAIRFKWSERAARWTADLWDDSESTCYVAGEPIEPVRSVNLAAIGLLPPSGILSLMLFGRFFRPGWLMAWSTEPLTTQDGISAVEFVYADQAEAALANAAVQAEREAA